VGLLLREDTLTNRVASPVKFAEYLRCGLPVILTPYIGDFYGLVRSEDVGRAISFPVKEKEVVEAAREIRHRLETAENDYRQLCSRVAAENFSWKGKIEELSHAYQTLGRR
jgi:glycosyltransferase involved in cell wall biosynthesis